jgi:hypothetical protein
MSLDAIICSLSAKRRALLEEDPEVLQELLDARHETDIPGLLDLGPTWHALDILLGDGKHPVLADAIVGRGGERLPGKAKARLLEPPRVAEIAKALAALPKNLVAEHYDSLNGKTVNGNLGQEVVNTGDKPWLRERVEKNRKEQIDTLGEALESLTAVYVAAAKGKQSMITVIVSSGTD